MKGERKGCSDHAQFYPLTTRLILSGPTTIHHHKKTHSSKMLLSETSQVVLPSCVLALERPLLCGYKCLPWTR